LRIIFAGTPLFAAKHLQALLESRHTVCAVYTQPDKPQGRGLKVTASPVKQLVAGLNIPVKQPTSFKEMAVQQEINAWEADIMVVIAYGLLLPPAVLTLPTLGCINVHASLLPRWRGAAPIQHAILAGDKVTGITIMQMDTGLDTGEMLYKSFCEITNSDTTESLYEKLIALGPQALITTLDRLEKKQLIAEKQDTKEACYAHKITKAQAEVDWRLSAIEIDRIIRAFNPWPIAYTHYQQQLVRIWQASVMVAENLLEPGTIAEINKHALYVMTGSGLLCIEKIQLPGSKPLAVQDILNGKKINFEKGQRFDGKI